MTDNIDDAFGPLATYLRANGRQAFNTETGGGNTDSCATYLCQQIAFVQQNSDGECSFVTNTKRRLTRLCTVFLGYVGWAAGNFDPSYVLSEVPTDTNGVWNDTSLVTACLAPK